MYNRQANSLVSYKWVTFCTTAWKNDTQDTSLTIGRTEMICLRCWLLSVVVGSWGLPDFSLCMNCVEWCCFQDLTQPFIMRRERRRCLKLKLECLLKQAVLHDGMPLLLPVIRSTMSESKKCTFLKINLAEIHVMWWSLFWPQIKLFLFDLFIYVSFKQHK